VKDNPMGGGGNDGDQAGPYISCFPLDAKRKSDGTKTQRS